MSQDISSKQLAEYRALFDVSAVQTQDNQLKSRLKERVLPYLWICAFVFALFLFELYRWMNDVPPNPVTVGGLFVLTFAVLVWRVAMHLSELKFLHLGRLGEPSSQLVLNEYVESTGGVMFADVEVGDQLVDHLIINNHGVTLINMVELQTPSNTDAVIEYSDREILFNGYRPDHNPLADIRDASIWLENRLYEALGHPVEILNIIVFPGWFVQRNHQVKSTVHILNPRELRRVLLLKRSRLSDNDNCLLNYHVSKIIKKAK